MVFLCWATGDLNLSISFICALTANILLQYINTDFTSL